LVECTVSDVLREPRINDVAPLGKNLALPILDACWILSGEKGCPFLDSQKRCSVYATRPWTCIAFAAGGKQCTELRQRAGLPPLQSIPADGSISDRLTAEMTNSANEEF
jgi:Fe-S-cluster containining protein